MERISHRDLPNGLMQSMLQVQHYIDNSGLDFKLLELVRMRVSQINSCAYCLDMHFKEGVAAGETPLRLVSVSAWRETPYYSLKEQAALAFAEVLTRLPEEQHSDDIHDELEKHFTKEEIANLTLAVAQINSWNRLTRSFGTVPGNYQPRQAVAAN
ncbi:carboxymuconolactone decarboxylase family protein [Terrimonas pollutisoli]|uniref:carboxymuconolactone decarboxylase family protein n=1 Tax=Terrimonas pollutisoli TaxID=3034147 RepID=UPI0023ED14F3|nr:carboxymuconolactone decarboxylase family protein [Terrimonas sp. H1YJ31]